MISFRYHLVSIIAVFLALAVGVLVGTTVVDQRIVDQLETRTRALAQTADDLRQQVDDQQGDLAAWRAFGDRVRPLLLDGQLTGRRVVLVTDDGIDLSQIDGVSNAVQESGASVVSVLLVGRKMSLVEPRARQEIASVLGARDTGSSQELRAEAARALAKRVADGNQSTTDLLRELVNRDFLAAQEKSTAGIDELGGPDQVVAVLAEYARVGCQYVIFRMPDWIDLEPLQLFAERVIPALAEA